MLGEDAVADQLLELRNVWELSHVIIFGFVTLGLISIAAATSLVDREP